MTSADKPTPQSNGRFFGGERVLVTGGSGFVGTNMIHALLKRGARVRLVWHERPPLVTVPTVELFQADLNNLEEAVKAADGMRYVFHCAGAVSGSGTSKDRSMAGIVTNLVLTARVLHACWVTDAEVIQIFGSSTAYPALDRPVTEDELWRTEPDPAYFGYGWMRRYVERLGEFTHQSSRTKVAIVRPTATYGPYDDFDPRTSHVLPALVRKAVERMDPYEVWGTGEEVRDFLYIDDLVRGCLLMVEHGIVGDPVNIGYGSGVTIRDIVGEILMAADYADAKVVYNSSKPTTIPIRVVDTSKARALLGFAPEASLAEGIARTVSWYRDNRSGSAAR